MRSETMAGGPSGQLIREVHRLFSAGAAGAMSDAQLLDQVIARRDQAAEAAFEELVIRHGPMVLRVCRSVLHDMHDAEDAFQAVFLVLANRAGSIRRSDSLASWLFGVAQRVAMRARRSAARRRAHDQLAAERTLAIGLPPEDDIDWEVVHKEIRCLPQRLRAPIVLCYMQGLTYAAAAQQLEVSEVALRGRLDRGRKRLRQRLIGRGVTVPAGLVVAGAASQAQAAMPAMLIHSTIRIALGFIAGNTAALLARGVLQTMLLHQLIAATILLCLGLGGGYWAWHAVASGMKSKGQTNPGPAFVQAPTSFPPPRTDRYGDPLPPGAAIRLGTVRFRQLPFNQHILYSPDGQLVVTKSGQHRLRVMDARSGNTVREIDLGLTEIRDYAFSPDGKTIAAVGFQLEPERKVVGTDLAFADVATGRLVLHTQWDDQSGVNNVVYTADSKTVATVSLVDETLRIWDVATAKLLHQERLVGEGNHEAIAFSPDRASRLLAIVWRQAIDLWDLGHARRIRRITIDGRYSPNCLVFSPDGTTLAAGVASRGAEIRLWRMVDGTLIQRFKSRKNAHVSFMAFSPDGKVLAAIGSGGPLVFFETATGKELDLLSSIPPVDGPLAFSPDGKTLASTGDRQTLHFWDLATGSDRLATLEAHQGDVLALACPADGKTLVSGSRDRTVRTWDLVTGRPTRMLAHENGVDSLSVSADGSLLATGSSVPAWGKVQVWNLKTGELLHTWSVESTKAARSILRGVTLSDDSSSVIAALGDGSLRRWDLATGQEHPIAQPKLEKLPRIEMGLDVVDRSVFSRDGPSVALIGENWVQVFDVASGDRRFKESTTERTVLGRRECAFAPGGGSLAIVREIPNKGFQVGSWSGSSLPTSTIVWLDSQSGDVRREIRIPDSYVLSLAFSPDGQAIAVGTLVINPARGIIRIFRLRDKREIQTIESPCPQIYALIFTPDGKQIAAGLGDTSIVVWEVQPTNVESNVKSIK